MTALIVAMLLCVGLAVAVVALVAIPARREGRDLLTARGERVVEKVKDRTEVVIVKAEGVLPRRDKEPASS
jgi:hypothetical protein